MGAQVPLRHPLRELFGALTEKSFTEHLVWPDLNVTSYVPNLLVDFTHTDHLYKIRNQQGQQVDTVVELLFESEVMLDNRQVRRNTRNLLDLIDRRRPNFLDRAKMR